MNKISKKPKLSFWEIWNMSFGFLGIQFGFALQNANVSRIFETLGAQIGNISILWIAAPVTGLVVQPIIGHLSDRTWNRLGRRRPYFLSGAILASLALIVMPNSPVLWVAAGMLWVMDASINVSMEPFRAFVGDMLPADQHTKGFALQSFFIGTGAVIASVLPYVLTNWLGLSDTAPAGQIPLSVKWSFYIGAVAFLGAVIWTVLKTEEYPPDEFERYTRSEPGDSSLIEAAQQGVAQDNSDKKLLWGTMLVALGAILTYLVYSNHLEKELYIFGSGIAIFGLVMITAAFMQRSGRQEHGLVVVMSDFMNMPTTMIQLSLVQFFSWFALFAMWIYTTPAVTNHIYGTSDTTSVLYNQGADWVGICFAVYNGFAAVIALILPACARLISRKVVHAISLLVGGISMAAIYYINDPEILLIPMVGIGLAWASILAMPYAILSGVLPASKNGIYMGLFNFFIVIPQIVAASILGFLVKQFFSGQAIYALIVGGIAMGLAALMMPFVNDRAGKIETEERSS